MNRFLFVGIRPSLRAEQIGATWQNGRLAGKTLRLALLVNGYDPDQQEYVNLWTGAAASDMDDLALAGALTRVRWLASQEFVVVAMGQIVARHLERAGVTHLAMVHPAARGAIRKKARYAAHLGQVLALGHKALGRREGAGEGSNL